MLEFFLPMNPPELAAAKAKLTAHLSKHRPENPLEGPLQLVAKWCFPLPESRKVVSGTYKDTRPDTDNLQKALKDCMTKLGYWKDDAQVASEIAEKFWAEPTGIYIKINQL